MAAMPPFAHPVFEMPTPRASTHTWKMILRPISIRVEKRVPSPFFAQNCSRFFIFYHEHNIPFSVLIHLMGSACSELRSPQSSNQKGKTTILDVFISQIIYSTLSTVSFCENWDSTPWMSPAPIPRLFMSLCTLTNLWRPTRRRTAAANVARIAVVARYLLA